MVKKKEKKNKVIDWLTNRYELIVRNEADFAERRTMTFTYAQLLFALFCTFALMMGSSLLLSKTLLSEWFNPEYEFNKLKYEIGGLAERTEVLEHELILKDRFIMTIKKRFDPNFKESDNGNKSSSIGNGLRKELIVQVDNNEESNSIFLEDKPLTIANEMLVFPFDRYNFIKKDTSNAGSQTLLFGLEIDENIKTIKSGIIDVLTWDKDFGYVVIINHDNRLKTIYSGLGVVLKNAGDFVSQGEVIGFSGENYNGDKSLVKFQMWHNNSPINPENYFIIKK